jgi:hypothetical protein
MGVVAGVLRRSQTPFLDMGWRMWQCHLEHLPGLRPGIGTLVPALEPAGASRGLVLPRRLFREVGPWTP